MKIRRVKVFAGEEFDCNNVVDIFRVDVNDELNPVTKKYETRYWIDIVDDSHCCTQCRY